MSPSELVELFENHSNTSFRLTLSSGDTIDVAGGVGGAANLHVDGLEFLHRAGQVVLPVLVQHHDALGDIAIHEYSALRFGLGFYTMPSLCAMKAFTASAWVTLITCPPP